MYVYIWPPDYQCLQDLVDAFIARQRFVCQHLLYLNLQFPGNVLLYMEKGSGSFPLLQDFETS